MENTKTRKSVTTGELLRAVRRARKLTQVGLAAAASMRQEHVSRIERGEVAPSLRTLGRLAAALGVPRRDLVGE